MQRIGLLVFGLLGCGFRPGGAQEAAGTTLWRVAATTVPTPSALAVGPAAAFWNPAQRVDSERVILAVEAIQTPYAYESSCIIDKVRVPDGKIGLLGIINCLVGISDIKQYKDSPESPVV